MMDRVEAAKRFIEAVKEEIRQKEREQAIHEKFEEIFGFEPEKVSWLASKTLKARAEIRESDLDEEILGRPVVKVLFTLEEIQDEKYDINWQFSQPQEPLYHAYKFTKKVGNYIASVEIMTRIYC